MMSSSREREDSVTFPTNPSSSSSPITVSDHLDSYLQDPTSHIGSAAGSYSNEGLLASEIASPSNSDVEFGFLRPDFRQQSPISGTVQFYERHVFLCYKSPSVWPPRIEAAEFDRLPRLLSAAVWARKTDMIKETRLTICEGHDGTETSNGDVLIFPDMIRYRRLTHFDVDTFVEEVLVKNGVWLPGTPEKLQGSFVLFVLMDPEIAAVEFVGLHCPCSHIGGHKYAGNVIIFGSNINGEVTGHWYGYVTPDDVPTLLEWHIGKGEITDSLWRGQMGLSEEKQKKFQELRRLANGETSVEGSTKEATERQIDEMNTIAFRSQDELVSCCQGNGSACYHDSQKSDIVDTDEGGVKLMPEKKRRKETCFDDQ
ncbi:WEB family protein [Hibiscus syriacus]|uniref:WEB family protein n=1 Tax=Hibiscus syriacus TaxID=106335 RepID=A0A6A3AI93_HIBSY|nr:WEB family protein [Hibiscus syriacus]